MDSVPLSAGPISLGVTTAIITSLIQSLGLTLQRKSHVKEESRPPHQRRRPFRRGLWRIGFAIFLTSNILGSSVQITTLPLVVLAPLQASGLIFNAILASLILHEDFTRLSLVGTVLVSVGAGLIAGFGALEEPSHNLVELLTMFSRTPFLIWMGIQFGVMVTTLVISRLLLISIRRKSALMDNARLGFQAISSVTMGRTIKRLKMVRGCISGCLSGLISAYCLLLAKTTVELIIRSITDENQFSQWQSWMIVFSLLVLELAQVLSSRMRLMTAILFEFRTTAVLDNNLIPSGVLHIQHLLHCRWTNILSTNISSNTCPNKFCRGWNSYPADRSAQPVLASLARNRPSTHNPSRPKSFRECSSFRIILRRTFP